MITLKSHKQVYLQIAEEYEKYILLGVYKLDEKLPSVREIADKLGVNPNTVNKSFKVLEEKKLIHILPKKGAFVTYNSKIETVYETIELQLKEIKKTGIKKDEIIKMIDEIWRG